MRSTLESLRPEMMVGGFARDDGLVSFYQRVHSLLRPNFTVVDFGCGRGEVFAVPQGYRSIIAKLQGHAAKVIGIDVDEAIHRHPYLDERHLIRIGDPLPVADQSVDLVVSDWVLEHIQQPEHFVQELERTLKPGGWFCARTPNKWGYAGLAARAIPNAVHTTLLKRLMPGRSAEDVFPTCYKLNSKSDLAKYFGPQTWKNYSYIESTTPKYFGSSKSLFRVIQLYQALAPEALQTNLLVFMQKVEA